MAHYVLTGTGRSGTKFSSELFNRLGWNCGHEDVFGPNLKRFESFYGYKGDASWLAVPHLPNLPSDAVILHQVRHPLLSIRSLASLTIFQHWWARRPLKFRAKNLLKLDIRRGPYYAFARYHCPDAWRYFSPFARAAWHWLDWNERVELYCEERPYIRFQIENLNNNTLKKIANSINEKEPSYINFPTSNVNTRDKSFDKKELNDLPSDILDKIFSKSERYGYIISDRE